MSDPAFLFDLDGTLVDSVYQHVLAWREALESAGIELSVWRIHRRIGMSGGLFLNALLRETGRTMTPDDTARVQRVHAEAFARQVDQVRPLPGARELLVALTRATVPWAIATSGRLASARPMLEMLGVPAKVPVITRDQVAHAKPDPDLFLAAAERLGAAIDGAVHSPWACCRAATGKKSWSGLGHTVSTRTLRTCCGTWTRSGSAGHRAATRTDLQTRRPRTSVVVPGYDRPSVRIEEVPEATERQRARRARWLSANP